MNVACPLAAFGGSMRPWSELQQEESITHDFALLLWALVAVVSLHCDIPVCGTICD